jgi:ABC-2 type transport system permease protein
LFFNFIFNFAEFEGFYILRGSTSTDLLKPQNYFVLKLFSTYGEAIVQNIIKGFLLIFTLVVLIFTKNISIFNPVNFGLFLLLVTAGLLILYFIEMIVGFSAFFLRQINGVVLNFGFLLGILMGRVFPLDLLIPSFAINFFNPFAYLFFHPMQIYLGKYNSTETILVFLGGIAWCVILYFLANFVFKMGLKRNESVGL